MFVIIFVVVICIFSYLLAHPMLVKYIKRLHRTKKKTFGLSLRQVLSLDNDDKIHVDSIADNFDRLYELSDAVKAAGLERSNVIIGIDFSASNEWQGRNSFHHKSLHETSKKTKNPYQQVISIIPDVLSPFDEDNLIPVFGFGCARTKDKSVFPFKEDNSPCKGFRDVLEQYERVKDTVELSGPTSLVPIINEAVCITIENGGYHILVIIMDGQVEEDQDEATQFAIIEASLYPLSIILVGVGDGPWDRMHDYDDKLPARQFDNFHFVSYHECISKGRRPEMTFALHALMEIPDQYKKIKSLGMLDSLPSTLQAIPPNDAALRRRRYSENKQKHGVIPTFKISKADDD